MKQDRIQQHASRGRLLVVSHAAVLPVNQPVYDALRSFGWDPTVIVPSRWRHEYSPEPFEPVPLPGMEERLVPKRIILAGRPQRHMYVSRLARVMREVAPRVTFIEEEAFSLSAFQWGLVSRKAAVPFGVQAFENLDRPFPIVAKILRVWVLRHAAFVAARSPAAAGLVTQLGARGKVVLTPAGVPDWQVAKRAAPNGFTVGFAGRLTPEKGLADLIEAARLLDSPVHLLLVGDGPMKGELERADLAGSDLRVWTGLPHERMPEAYAHMDVLVLPSRTTLRWAEQFGRVLVEALWCGVPVVGSDSGEIPWVIQTTGGGRVVPEGNPAALARALADLRANPVERRTLANRGQASAQRLFSVAAAAVALDDALVGATQTDKDDG